MTDEVQQQQQPQLLDVESGQTSPMYNHYPRGKTAVNPSEPVSY